MGIFRGWVVFFAVINYKIAVEKKFYIIFVFLRPKSINEKNENIFELISKIETQKLLSLFGFQTEECNF